MSEYAFVYQPQIIRETAEGLNRLDIRDEMLDQRELELMTSVDAESCAVVIRGLLHLQRQNPTAPITLYITTARAAKSSPAWRFTTSCKP